MDGAWDRFGGPSTNDTLNETLPYTGRLLLDIVSSLFKTTPALLVA